MHMSSVNDTWQEFTPGVLESTYLLLVVLAFEWLIDMFLQLDSLDDCVRVLCEGGS